MVGALYDTTRGRDVKETKVCARAGGEGGGVKVFDARSIGFVVDGVPVVKSS